jgi:sirohydrochlorin ferrochelatase
MKTALLLIAHGSRHVEANDDLHALVDELRESGEYAVVDASFLELAEPAIEAAGGHCVGQGAERVILLPYFLSAGVHVKRVLLAQPLGRHPLLREIVMQRAREAK